MVPPQQGRSKRGDGAASIGAMPRRRILLAPLALALAGAGDPRSFTRGAITVDHPWAKPSVTEAAAMFVRIRNDGPRADRLVGGTTPIAERVILRELDGSPLEYIDVLPRRPVSLRPGRRYIALRGLKRLLAIDDSFPLTLVFAAAGPIAVTVTVEEGPEDQ
jgi:copper(I)-binding protein